MIVNITDARTLAVNLMTKHGLIASGWRFEFDGAVKRLGVCKYTQKTISISRHMVGAAEIDVVEQTMIHEIAHALIPTHDQYGKRIGHGCQWKMKAASIGYTGKRTVANPYQAELRRQAAEFVTVVGAGQRVAIPVDTGLRLELGATVHSTAGTVGVVTKFARTRVHVTLGDGSVRTCLPHTLTVTTAADRDVVSAIRTAAAPKFRTKDRIRINDSSPFGGSAGTILAVNRTRYRVQMEGTSTIVAVPFQLAVAA